MITMDDFLKDLYRKDIITKEEAITHALDRISLQKNID